MSLFTAVLLLGILGIIRTRVRRNGLVAGLVFSFFPVALFLAAVLFLGAAGIFFNQAAYNFSDEGEKAQQAWRQEQIDSTGIDPCAGLYAAERGRRQTQERVDSGVIGNGELLSEALSNSPYADMSWEEREAALARDAELSEKCPPLDYIESQQ
ncbi:hypothetical protein [Corynebacterium senegalense]|uniref:hypothetical protein n=1 Tax=Corynebacterium senegalense TaxID=2080750 RepID=UPI000E2058C3|nr:hypothetical protein [Corynebacterium senegalense]